MRETKDILFEKMTGNDPTPSQFIQSLLPEHYTVKETITGIIRCKSSEGIEDELSFNDFFNRVKKYFGNRVKEVFHTTCYNHRSFTIYYDGYSKKQK